MARRNASLRSIAKSIEADLLKTWGPIVGGMDLVRILGYRTTAALRQARASKRLRVPVFKLEGRKGTYAFVKDLALWLAKERVKMSQTTETPEGKKEVKNTK